MRAPGGRAPGGRAPGGRAPGGRAPGGRAPGGRYYPIAPPLMAPLVFLRLTLIKTRLGTDRVPTVGDSKAILNDSRPYACPHQWVVCTLVIVSTSTYAYLSYLYTLNSQPILPMYPIVTYPTNGIE